MKYLSQVKTSPLLYVHALISTFQVQEFPKRKNYKGQVLIQLTTIQGGASGIGLALTCALHRLGANVYVADFVDKVPSSFPSSTEKTVVHFTGSCDVSKRADCKRFIDSIPGRLDGMVNCAGIAQNEGQMASEELFHRTIAVNLIGTVRLLSNLLLPISSSFYT